MSGGISEHVICHAHVCSWPRESPLLMVELRWWFGGTAASCGGGWPEKSPKMQFLIFPSSFRFFKAFDLPLFVVQIAFLITGIK